MGTVARASACVFPLTQPNPTRLASVQAASIQYATSPLLAHAQIERERQRIAARRQLKEAELNEIMAEMQYAEAYRAAFPDEAYPEPDHGRSPSPRSPAAQRRSQPRVPVDRRAYDLGEGAPAGPTGQRGAGALSEYTRDLAEIPPPPRDPTRSRCAAAMWPGPAISRMRFSHEDRVRAPRKRCRSAHEAKALDEGTRVRVCRRQPQVKVMATDKERRQAELNEEMAAIKIQAHFRGHRDRKRVRKLRMLYTRDSLVIREGEVMQELRDIEEKMRVQEAIMMREAQQLEMHVEAMLQDQEADRRQQGHTDEQERAAVRIQSHYRGHKGRQRAEKLKSQYDRLKRQREAKFQELEAITAAQAPPPPRWEKQRPRNGCASRAQAVRG